MTGEVAQLNAMTQEEAVAALLQCCGSLKWARKVADERPFDDMRELLLTADHVWWSLDALDWLEAFSAHPKIGEKKAAPVASESSRWSQEEQAGASRAAVETLDELTLANHDYERRFGYIFIVCATGKSADEMLALMHERLKNEPDTELRIAAEEQRRITHLRLEKLLSQ
ncbi:MAG TPA: 2-oxo-4-hydroxy-4-carboxy-5-ureidoimidazoline decarboxylase [Pyrinomonadaceae bacterium]|jgi:OHCU decarboxylase